MRALAYAMSILLVAGVHTTIVERAAQIFA
jgi:hypothetical protein